MPPGKTKTETTMDPAQLCGPEPAGERVEQPGPSRGPSMPADSAGSCPEAYQRLLSSFYCKGTHGIMSPLAKKKLLAQVSKAGALQCQEESCQHRAGDPPGQLPAPPAACPRENPPSPGAAVEEARQKPGAQEAAPGPGEEAPVGPGPSAPVFTGCFHTCPTEVLKPISRHPRDFPSLKDGVLWGPRSKEGSQLVWGGDASRPSAFHRGGSRDGSPYPKPKACWVSPMAKAPAESPAPHPTFPGGPGPGPGPGSKRRLEEEGVSYGGKKLRAVSPFLKETDAKECEAKPAGPGLSVSCLLGPASGPGLPEAYRGTMLRCPLNLTGSLDPLKGPATFPFSPLVIPAFPAHFLTSTAPLPMATGLQHFPPTPFDSALRHRLYPGASAWHVPPATTYAAPHFFHLNTKL